MRRWMYLDGPLAAFVLVMIAAAIITSHGTYLFYSYLLPTALASAATVVLTVGIPLLELAAVLETRHRWLYIGGIVVLVGLEGLAQYFQAQAGFVARVATQFPDPTGIDVATFARQPWGRALPVLYLALLSIVVVYFGYAASSRIRILRSQAATTAQDTNRVAHLAAALAQAEAATAQLRAQLAQLQQQATAHDSQAAQVVAQLQAELTQAHDQLRGQADQLAQLQADGAQEVTISGVSLRKAAQALDIPESTLRSRLKAVATNGHGAG